MADIKESEKAIKDFLDLQHNKVKKNTEIVCVQDMKYPFMLHIDAAGKTPKSFYPQMPRRASLSEDNTMARVTVADTLLGCIIAYAAVTDDFHNRFSAPVIEGYEINVLEYMHCLKPNDKLVYDAEATNEHWLVGYDKEFVHYKPRTVGRLFCSQLAYTRRHDRQGKLNALLTKMVMCLKIDEEIPLSKNKSLKPGYYVVNVGSGEDWSFDRNSTFDDEEYLKVKSIDKSEFMKFKKIHAPELSLEQSTLLRQW